MDERVPRSAPFDFAQAYQIAALEIAVAVFELP